MRTPVLYLGGEYSTGSMLDGFVQGLREDGLRDVRGRLIPNSGHFMTDEQPERVLAALRQFMGLDD